MISKIFIDSDVIIDFLTDRVLFAEFSSTVFELSEKGLLELCTSALCYQCILSYQKNSWR